MKSLYSSRNHLFRVQEGMPWNKGSSRLSYSTGQELSPRNPAMTSQSIQDNIKSNAICAGNACICIEIFN